MSDRRSVTTSSSALLGNTTLAFNYLSDINLFDEFKESIPILCLEGRHSKEHLIDEAP
jgi:hypothetical protein